MKYRIFFFWFGIVYSNGGRLVVLILRIDNVVYVSVNE